MSRASPERYFPKQVPLSEVLTLYQELQEHEALLRAVLYSIGDAVMTCDEHGKVTLLNPAAEALTGWTEAEAQGKALEDIFRIINEETRQPAENPAERVLREGVVLGLANHTLLIRRDGSEVPIADSGAPIRGEGGKIRGVVLVFRDQSAERAAQRAVEEARRFAEGIVETVREPLIVLDGDLCVVRANPAFYRLFHTTPEETENHLLYELGNGQWNIPELRRLLEEILPGNTRFENFEVRHEFPKIGRRIMLLNARRIYHEDNRTRFILLAIEDVTERQQAVDSLNHSEERYRAISEMISDYAYAFEVMEDGSLKREWVAGGFERITGFTPEESEARGGWQALIYPPDMPIALRRAERLMSGRQDTSEFRIMRKDGGVRWLRDHGLPVWDEDRKRVVRIYGAAQDITEQKQHERELEAQALVVQILQEEADLPSLLERLLQAACHAISTAEKGTILLADPDGRLHMRAMTGYQDVRVMNASFPVDSGYAAKAFRLNQPLNIEDARAHAETRYDGEIGEIATVQSAIAAPLVIKGRAIGVLSLDNCSRKSAFSDQDLQVLTTFAATAALMIERTRLFEETRQRLTELSVLHSVSQALMVSGMQPEVVYEAIHHAVAQLMACEAFVIVLVDALSSEYLAVYLFDKGGRHPPQRIPRGKGLSGKVIEQGKTLVIEDYLLSELPGLHFGDAESVRSILAVPLRQGERVLGMISAQSYQPGVYTLAHCRLLETLAAQFTTTLENVRLFGETRQRLRELELIAHLSAELRQAATRSELLPVLLQQLMTQMKVEGAVLETVHPLSGDVRIELGVGIWEELTGQVIPAGQGLSAVVLQSGLAYLNNNARHDPRVFFPQQLGDCASIAGVPLRADDTINGLLWIGSCRSLDENDLRLLHAVADMAASALLRLQLHEETRRRVEQLQALQAIDRVITTSLDLRFSLDALLEQTLLHLKMDAAGVLLFNPTTLMLEYAAGRGFRGHYYQKARLHLGESQAGLAALERRIVHCGDLDVAE
ncbi:MAG: GAF domain-containing protein, partial [Bellilinea sp.]